MSFININNLQLYYEKQGTGPRLLYISGSGDLRKRPNVFDSPLASRFELLAYDQRGLGQSDKPDIAYTMVDYANDASEIMRAVGWDRALVMGVSFGGMVAQELALRQPDMIQKLVSACTSSSGAGGASYPLHTLMDLSAEARTRTMIPIADTRCDEAWQADHPTEYRAMIAWSLNMAAVGADEPGRQIGARRQLEARAKHDTYDRLPELAMPVYVCGGRYDGLAMPSNQQALTQQIPHAYLAFFEDGHSFLAQDRAAYESIIEFLLADS